MHIIIAFSVWCLSVKCHFCQWLAYSTSLAVKCLTATSDRYYHTYVQKWWSGKLLKKKFFFSHLGDSVSLPGVWESSSISRRLPNDPGGFKWSYIHTLFLHRFCSLFVEFWFESCKYSGKETLKYDVQQASLQMTLSPKLGVVEISTLWHFRLPLPVQMFIKVVSSPRLSGIGMPSPILWSHPLKMQRIVLLYSLLWWELGINSLITGPDEWLSFRRFTSELFWSWSYDILSIERYVGQSTIAFIYDAAYV